MHVPLAYSCSFACVPVVPCFFACHRPLCHTKYNRLTDAGDASRYLYTYQSSLVGASQCYRNSHGRGAGIVPTCKSLPAWAGGTQHPQHAPGMLCRASITFSSELDFTWACQLLNWGCKLQITDRRPAVEVCTTCGLQGTALCRCLRSSGCMHCAVCCSLWVVAYPRRCSCLVLCMLGCSLLVILPQHCFPPAGARSCGFWCKDMAVPCCKGAGWRSVGCKMASRRPAQW